MSKVLNALAAYNKQIALETSEMKMTYGELEQAVVLAQRLLVDSRVAAIMMENSPAWIIMDLACIATNITLLPLPSFFSEKQIQHALTHL